MDENNEEIHEKGCRYLKAPNKCFCSTKYQNIHIESCKFYIAFVKEMNRYYRWNKDKDLKNPDWSGQPLCCCCKDVSYHTEASKLEISFLDNDERKYNFPLFEEVFMGSVADNTVSSLKKNLITEVKDKTSLI